MADPFSVIAGTAGLADVCIRLTRFLKHAKDGFRAVDEELDGLAEEIESLRSTNEFIKRSYTEGSITKINSDHQQILNTQWQTTQTTLASCQHITEQIEGLLNDVANAGSGKHIRLDQIRKWLKQQSSEETLSSLRGRLQAHQIALQLSLSAVSMSVSRYGPVSVTL